MKTTMCAIAATLVLSAFAQDDLDKLLTALEDGDYAAKRMVETEDFQKVLSTTNDSKTVAEKVKMAMLLNKMSGQYERLQHLQKNIEERKAKIAEESLPEDAVAQLSAAAQEYYARQMKDCSNDLERVMLEVKEMKLKWTDETVAGFEYWKQRQADKETIRKMEEKLRRERSERDDKAREEVSRLRYKLRPKRCKRNGCHIEWDYCSENVSSPDECYPRMRECEKNLKEERKNLAELELVSQERIAKLSPLAKEKYQERLDECKRKIEGLTAKQKMYEEVWAENKWAPVSEWKKQYTEKRKAWRNKQRVESLANDEIRAAIEEAKELADPEAANGEYYRFCE